MKKYGVNELREMYLSYFEERNGHLRMNSFSLVPHNDKSLLLINAGMAPLKPYFTGQEIPPRRRVTTCQKCIRTGDIENVGKTARHGTFFEMLGNFSFGDYFKHEAIKWSWEFLTEVVGLDADRLYPSIYQDDDEAFDIWNKEVGIAPESIFRFGKADNFWEHGAGPCGPCSEIYYDRGEKYGCGKPDCTVGCDCDRYMEVWNNVFTQFENDGKGNYTTLQNKNIDTGMGLERLAVVVQDVDSIFDVDTIKAIRDKVSEIAGIEYGSKYESDVSIRVITDHMRSATFMTSDGITPSNEGRGYVLRRLIRRAARHGRLLGVKGAFLNDVAATVIENSKDAYPELEEKKAFIFSTIEHEEASFNKTIDQGLEILAEYKKELKEKGSAVLDGEKAFKLHDTYGFPLDLTKDILEEDGLSVDEDKFRECMEIQKTTARNARKVQNYMGADATVFEQISLDIKSEFDGYDKLEKDDKILALTLNTLTKAEDGTEKVVSTVEEKLTEGANGAIIVASTPFYATMGGQTGDTGIIKTDNGTFVVQDTTKVAGDKIAHHGYVESGEFSVGDIATLSVDSVRRGLICKNHSATHLLQKALKTVLGDHVEQKGSFVSEGRLRFDFSHNQAMSSEEIAKVEKIVNEKIAESIPVETKIMTIEEAKKTGAMALFGEKYGETVRVVMMSDFSKEFCGGTHVSNTSTIGTFKIVSEAGISSGVRRIEALTGEGALEYYKETEAELAKAAAAAKTEPAKLADKIEALLAEIKSLTAENKKLKDKIAKDAAGDALSGAEKVKDTSILKLSLSGADINSMRNLGDDYKAKLGNSCIIMASDADGKVSLLVMASDDAVAAGIHAGNIIKKIAPIVGGGGGGRPNMAQAGGKDASKIEEALAAGVEEAKNML
ncbi:MAG: alanine--tRNA ligase [Eubacterium sp.]|nr:alanine--tRNA ligase [Eubacterium sp.]